MTASFIHEGSPLMASWRYRAFIPSRELGLAMNDYCANTLVFAKPQSFEIERARVAHAGRQKIVVDFCDPHFDQPHYMEFALLADAITCPTQAMADEIERRTLGDWVLPKPIVIADPFEYPEEEPHCNGTNLLWYGHGVNMDSLIRVMRQLDDYPLMIVSNTPWSLPWSHETMLDQFALADIVVIPATAAHKSPNRAVEAIRQGCFVVAEPHPGLNDIPGIWIGNLKEGIEWASHNAQEANRLTLQAQDWVARKYSPQTLASAWKNVLDRMKSRSTSEVGSFDGPAGSMSMGSTLERRFSATY